MSQFLEEIKGQPEALRAFVSAYVTKDISKIKKASDLISMQESVIFTGMGTSYFAPFFIRDKIASTVKMINIEAGELYEYNLALIRRNDPIVMISQSGESIEIRNIVDAIRENARIIGITNDPDSTLGVNSEISLSLYSGYEASITNKTYTNTLAVLSLLGHCINGKNLQELLEDLRLTADKMDEYLSNDSNIHVIKDCAEFLAPAEAIHFIGRGASGLVSAYQAALIFMEGAKCYTHGFTSGAFRHGPMELCKRNHKAVIFAPEGKAYQKNISLAEELEEHGSKVVLMTNSEYKSHKIKVVNLPASSEDSFAFLAALAFEMLLVFTAQMRGYTAGEFEIGQKITVID